MFSTYIINLNVDLLNQLIKESNMAVKTSFNNVKLKDITLEKATYELIKDGIKDIRKMFSNQVLFVIPNHSDRERYRIRLVNIKDVGLVISFSNKMAEHFVLRDPDEIDKLISILESIGKYKIDIREALYLPNNFHECMALSKLSAIDIDQVWLSGYFIVSVVSDDFKDEKSIKTIFELSKIISVLFVSKRYKVLYRLS